jgi:formate hydrogenlyase subunit 3/multisubunit Na+/H+ antiporter MnhD subunit
MDLLVAGLLVIAGSGALALLLGLARLDRLAIAAATLGAVAGGVVAAIPAVDVLLGGAPLSALWPWDVPLGELALRLDRLAALFLMVILGIGAVASVYGAGYLEHYRGKRQLGPVLFFFNLLIVAMSSVVVARNVILFLFAWETMTFSAFLLVCFEDEHEEVRRAGLTYLVLSHLATIVIFAFFFVLGRETGSYDIEKMASHGPLASPLVHVLFVMAVVGFGTKCGIWPLHVWLPEAHPAAPTHVSALMSAVIVKTALYALIRGITLLGEPHGVWGLSLMAVGATSGVLAILNSLAQHDLKRLLAYSTIENVGIILIGIGAGLVGVAWHAPAIAVLGFSGALLHVVNHALMKSLLFFGAGSVLQSTGTRQIERLGGLAKTMPWTAVTFGLGAAAVSALPGLNGFTGEWLIYSGLFRSVVDLGPWSALASVAAIAALALIGGLAAATFTKAVGTIFLGSPRGDAAAHAHEGGPLLVAPMVLLALACVVIGFQPQLPGAVVVRVAGDLARADDTTPVSVVASLSRVSVGVLLTVGVALTLAAVRQVLLAGKPVEQGATWGCGYGSPTPRLQYTASSFTDPIAKIASAVLRTRVRAKDPSGWFPATGDAVRATTTDDLVDERALRPAVSAVARALIKMRWLQQGRIQLYFLYIVVALVSLLVWQLLLPGGKP